MNYENEVNKYMQQLELMIDSENIRKVIDEYTVYGDE